MNDRLINALMWVSLGMAVLVLIIAITKAITPTVAPTTWALVTDLGGNRTIYVNYVVTSEGIDGITRDGQRVFIPDDAMVSIKYEVFGD